MGIFQTEAPADKAAAHYGAEGALAARINALQDLVTRYASDAGLADEHYPMTTALSLFGGATVQVSYCDTEDGPAIGRLLINGTPCDAQDVFAGMPAWDAANLQLEAVLDAEDAERTADRQIADAEDRASWLRRPL